MSMPQWNPDEARTRAVTRSPYLAETPDHELAVVDRMPDAFQLPQPTLVMHPDGFVKGIMIQQSATAPSVLTRKNKNVDLPGGLLVALRQLQGTEHGCQAPGNQ